MLKEGLRNGRGGKKEKQLSRKPPRYADTNLAIKKLKFLTISLSTNLYKS